MGESEGSHVETSPATCFLKSQVSFLSVISRRSPLFVLGSFGQRAFIEGSACLQRHIFEEGARWP